MIYLEYPNLLNFLFYGSATELQQVDPITVKPAISFIHSVCYMFGWMQVIGD